MTKQNFAVSSVDGLDWYETRATADTHALSLINEISREFHDGIDEDAMGSIKVLQTVAAAVCVNPDTDYRIQEYTLKELATTPYEIEAMRILRDLSQALTEIEDTPANRNVDPAKEDSYWVAGNIGKMLRSRMQRVIDTTKVVEWIDLHLRQHAMILLMAGWQVRLSPNSTKVRWYGPQDQTHDSWESTSIDCPPQAVIDFNNEMRRRMNVVRPSEPRGAAPSSANSNDGTNSGDH